MAPRSSQQPLFGEEARAAVAAPDGFDFDAAARVPAGVKLGTSSWVYPGWQGQVYQSTYGSDRAFSRDALAEYVRWPGFRAVGIDATFYGPPAPSTVARWDAQLPSGFAAVAKAWEHVTIPRFPQHARYGARAGELNPRFLDAELVAREVLPPLDPLGERLVALLFQLPPLEPRVLPHMERFVSRVDRFLAALPRGPRYAIEIRNPELLRAEWFAMLRERGASHCFSASQHMPSLAQQRAAAEEGGGLAPGLRLARLLTPPGVSYKGSVARFSPYDRLRAPLPTLRAEAVELLVEAVGAAEPAIVLVNNRLEGNSPATIDALSRMLVARLG